MPDLVPEECVVPAQLADKLLGVRVDDKLVWIEAVPGVRLVGAVNPVAVYGPRTRIGKVTVPNLVRVFRKGYALELPLPRDVENAKLDALGVGGEQGEVDAEAVPGCAQGVRISFAEAVTGHLTFLRWELLF